MRLTAITLVFTCCGGLAAQDDDKLAKRYTFDVNERDYPQGTPQETLKSVVRAITGGKVEYLMAHLVEPEHVDAKVEKYKELVKAGKEGKALAAFQRVAKEAADHFLEDPELVQQLKRFVKEGDWKEEKNAAMASVKNLVGRHVFMKQIGKRWFLENRQQ